MTREELIQAYQSGQRDFRGVILRRTNLGGTDLRGTVLRGTDLIGANLQGADLRGADLRGADLQGANLRGIYLGDQWIIQGGIRSDGYAFFLQKLTQDSEPMIKAGCRYFTISDAQKHWTDTRGGTPLFTETRAIIRAMVDCAHARGYMINGRLK